MQMLVAAVLASILACLNNVAAVSVGLEKGVAVLNHTNFDDAKASKNFPVLLAAFYRPREATSTELIASLEKAAGKELKGMKVRLAKIDADAEASLASKYAIDAYPSIVAFKDGSKHSQHDATLWQKQEIRAYAAAVTGEAYLFNAREVYNGARFNFKIALRSTPLPGSARQMLYTGFPVVLLMLILCPCCCFYCCCSSPAPKKQKKKPSTSKSASSSDPAEDEKEGEKTEKDEPEKDDDEKKDD
jgi:hypothetical protein|mmetsp:Transcript_5461/g.8451  ORF Transcript_5461/g.8451 Transcript_5461/m.8451 type:complete len:245 (+) Transcript_5461:44-778(+)